jgi:PAS domain S-box-containing protein
MKESTQDNLLTLPKLAVWPTLLIGIVVLKALLSLTVSPNASLSSFYSVAYFLLLFLATALALRNAIQNTLKGRPFWIFLAMAYGLWALDQWIFLHYQFGLHTDVPDNSIADTVMFLHIILMMAAVATLPHRSAGEPKLYHAVLNSLLLLIFWGFVYGYAVFPYQLFSNASSYALRFDIVYPIENWALILGVGILCIRARVPWKTVYLQLLGASTVYVLSSFVANLAIDSGGHVQGKIYGIGLTAAACWFVWIPLRARQLTDEGGIESQAPQSPDSNSSAWAMLVVVLIAFPLVWEFSPKAGTTDIRVFRLLVVIAAIVSFAGAAFIKEYLTKRELASHLGAANARLHLAMESGRAMGWDWNVKTKRIAWFGDLKTNFGFDSTTVVGHAQEFLERYIHQDDRERVFNAIVTAREKHELYAGQFRVVWPDGTLRSVTARGRFQYSSHGEPVRMLGIAADVSDRIKLELDLKESRDRMSAIVESAMDAIIAIDESRTIVLFNTSAEKMFACSRQEALGSSIDRFIPLRHRSAHGDHIRQFGETGSSSRAMGTLGTLWASKSSGEEFPIEASISHGNIAGKQMFTVIVRDITERHRAESNARESEGRFRLVANAAPVLIWMAGADKLCTFCSQGWLNFTGRTIEQELGHGWTDSVHPEDLSHCLETYFESFDARIGFEMEYRLKRHDGEYRWLLGHGVPRFESDGTFCGYIGSCLDITERKTAEQSLHNLTGQLISAQEEERLRIARELHDDFSQRLALLGIGLGQLWKKLSSDDEEERASLAEMLKATREMSTDLHTLSHQLHSSKLEHVGLAPALTSLCREISQKYQIEVGFVDSTTEPNIPKDVALCLFRVTQEGLANVVKHSRSKTAKVTLQGDPGEVTLRISDSGIGFDHTFQTVSLGLGMVGMSERLRLVGGRFTVNSQPNQGTEIVAVVTLSDAENVSAANAQAVGR